MESLSAWTLLRSRSLVASSVILSVDVKWASKSVFPDSVKVASAKVGVWCTVSVPVVKVGFVCGVVDFLVVVKLVGSGVVAVVVGGAGGAAVVGDGRVDFVVVEGNVFP